MIDWNRGFQAGWEAAASHKSEAYIALQALKDDHRTFVNNASIALAQNDERIHSLENKISEIYAECADICNRRADSLTSGSDIARLCARDINSRKSSHPV